MKWDCIDPPLQQSEALESFADGIHKYQSLGMRRFKSLSKFAISGRVLSLLPRRMEKALNEFDD